MSLFQMASMVIIAINLGFYFFHLGDVLTQIKHLLWVFLGVHVLLFEVLAGMVSSLMGDEDES